MYTTKLLTTVLALASIVSFGQELEKEPEIETKGKLKLSGSVDAYYQTNLNSSDNLNQSFGSSFADQTGFALGMANVVLGYEGEKTGIVFDLAFGSRGIGAVGGDFSVDPNTGEALSNDNDFFINQMYAYWNISEKTTITAGRFNTYLGYEVISPVGNFNYSTSHLFSNGPFSHVGLKADFALTEDFSLMLAVMNVTDVNNNMTGEYALGAQAGYKGQFLNFYYDDKASLGFEVDYTGGFDVTDEFYLGINAAYQTVEDASDEDENGGFYGVALYPQYALSESFGLGLRGEYFADHSSVDDFDSTGIIGVTLTGSYTVENLTIKPEVRLDSWGNDEEPFTTGNDGDTASSLAAFTIGAIYSF